MLRNPWTTRFGKSARRFVIPTVDEMQALGKQIAKESIPQIGDVILLDGDIGAGKTCFARGYIRQALHQPTLAVTSPTYLLQNTYDCHAAGSGSSLPIHHIDLYRLPTVTASDFHALGFDSMFQTGVSLIEWSDRLPSGYFPREYLHVDIVEDGDCDKRLVTIQAAA